MSDSTVWLQLMKGIPVAHEFPVRCAVAELQQLQLGTCRPAWQPHLVVSCKCIQAGISLFPLQCFKSSYYQGNLYTLTAVLPETEVVNGEGAAALIPGILEGFIVQPQSDSRALLATQSGIIFFSELVCSGNDVDQHLLYLLFSTHGCKHSTWEALRNRKRGGAERSM